MACQRVTVIEHHLSASPTMASGSPGPLTTHILDTASGSPAANVPILLYKEASSSWTLIAEGSTNSDGRCPGLLTQSEFTAGTYKIHFNTKAYFNSLGIKGFYPYVEVVFEIERPLEHYHVPLLLSPFAILRTVEVE
ncbi:hypothetical protein CAPTEDRAFT_223510 [Capitella teleta]|uniref:5-hydroxyisourate hydrolase n=1 Tax=Capitella teleta TaxID=283909 RepID=R7UE73_CAPTE|nr:hypothetical protein CAPTEDRAFT_223510 [Capitella teleta]|eukprot:ELU04386.1 hypothetical protein CAPTEDRAFT_223510 [Capitella teleta]